MAEVSPLRLEPSRKALQGLLQRLARMPLAEIARAIGKSESTACRVRDGESPLTLAECIDLLDAAGLKVVDKGKVCVDRAIYDAMASVATKAMGTPEIARQLVWDDE